MNIYQVRNKNPQLNTIASMVVIAKETPEFLCPYGPEWIWDEEGENWYITFRNSSGELTYHYFPINLWDTPENLEVKFLGASKTDVSEVVELASFFEQ